MYRLLIISIIAVGYGIFGMFYYFPSLEYMDKPFPLEHSINIIPNPDGNGYAAWTFADPLVSANVDPYWVAWSVSLYFGIATFTIFVFKSMAHRKTIG